MAIVAAEARAPAVLSASLIKAFDSAVLVVLLCCRAGIMTFTVSLPSVPPRRCPIEKAGDEVTRKPVLRVSASYRLSLLRSRIVRLHVWSLLFGIHPQGGEQYS